MALTARLDRRAVAVGGGAALAVLVPTFLAVRAAGGDDGESDLILLFVLAFLVAFPLAGGLAAARAPSDPFAHAALASALAYVAVVAVNLARRWLAGDPPGLVFAPTFLIFGQIAVGLAILGAFAVTRRSRRRGMT